MQLASVLVLALPALASAVPVPSVQAETKESIYLGTCAGPQYDPNHDGVPLLIRAPSPYPNPCQPQGGDFVPLALKTSSMAAYFPKDITFGTGNTAGYNTQPDACVTVADPSIPWEDYHRTTELAKKTFSVAIEKGVAKGAVAGSVMLDKAKFTCVRDGTTVWNARNEMGWWKFGCTVDYACTRV